MRGLKTKLRQKSSGVSSVGAANEVVPKVERTTRQEWITRNTEKDEKRRKL